jgi:competence protein ComEC
LDSLYNSSGNSALHGKSIACYSRIPLPPCGTVSLKGFYHLPEKKDSLLAFDQYTFFLSSGLWGSFYANRILGYDMRPSAFERVSLRLRALARSTFDCVAGGPLRGIYRAAFLGEKEDLTPEIKESFKRAGVYHLVALSGFHVALIMAPLSLLLFFLPLRKELKILAAIAAAWSYLAFVGFVPSLFRAVVMVTLFLASFLFQRKSYSMNTLGLAGLLWLFAYPRALFAPGFQLSFAATAGLLALFPALRPLLRAPKAGVLISAPLNALFGAFTIAVAAFLATAPVLVYHFGTLSPYGLGANIAASTLMSLSMWTFLAGAAIRPLFAPAAYPVFFISEQLMGAIVSLATFSTRFSWSRLSIRSGSWELYAVYAAALTGYALVRPGLRRRYIAWSVPAVCALAPASILLRRLAWW